MNLLSVENLSVFFGERVLFEDLSFGLNKGDKIALIASNGTGKSTLFKILAGRDVGNTGTVTFRDGVRISYLEQEPDFDKDKTINEIINSADNKTLEVVKEYQDLVKNEVESFSEFEIKRLEELTQKMEIFQAWDYERRMEQILTMFKIVDFNQKISELSGGQKKRLALSMVLIDSPDILLLDEPTNHLDIEMIEWLEDYLSRTNITLFMVTHDRYFLDNVCNHIIEMEDEKIYHHKGNYKFYLEKKAEREAVFSTELVKANRLYKKELEWMRTSPQARTTKSKSRIESFYEIEKKAKNSRQKKEIQLDVKVSRLGSKIIELRNVCKSFGDIKILENFSYTFKKGEKVGVVGNNGCGKSTLLKLITNQIKADEGKIIHGETVVFGHYEQDGLQFDESKKVIDIVNDLMEEITLSDGRKVNSSQFLDYFLFPHKMQQSLVHSLSGGEKRRLYLLTVLLKNPNFLILDEPTNDLDLPTLNKLEEFLTNFGGCLMIVSHDRYFLDTLCDHIFVFKGNGEIKDYYDTYSSYRELSLIEEKQLKLKTAESKTIVKSDNSEKKKSNKPSYKQKQEFEQLETQISNLEKEKTEIEAQLQVSAENSDKMISLSERYAIILEEIDEKSHRWLELSELFD